MAYLNTYSPVLTAQTAAHLLRRATFGPTQAEITLFTGKSATEAIDLLISNAAFTATPPEPVEMNDGDQGQPFLHRPFVGDKSYDYFLFIRYWWMGLMTQQNGNPSILEKLTAFWQNHFVVSFTTMLDYRFTNRYLRLLRYNALGNFRTLATEITKDPGMLIFQNGNENTKEFPNENYARELQELFTVGQKDFAGNENYTEQDVKAASQVLTGWIAKNYYTEGSTTIGTEFISDRHETADKQFSASYNGRVIAGRTGSSAGDEELADLISMLLDHKETPRFICRKLYRWFVNPNVTQEIEDNVIHPLAIFFSSSNNNYSITPVIKLLLSSDIFYESRNIGAIVKSPAEHTIGIIRFFNFPVPNISSEFIPFRRMMEFMEWRMSLMELKLLAQNTVFGSIPYYQSGYSKNWINATSLGLRGQTVDNLIWPYLEIKPGYTLGIDFLQWIKSIQPDFLNLATPSISASKVVDEFSKNLYAIELTAAQKVFLIDKIMMREVSRATWIYELNQFRASPNDVSKQDPILWRCMPLMTYMLKMAEFHVF